MVNIAIHLTGRPSNGGSYQYWLNILESLTLLDKSEYKIYCYSLNREWKEVVELKGFIFREETYTTQILGRLIEAFLEPVLPLSFLRKFSYLWKPFVRMVKNDNVNVWIAQKSEIPYRFLGIPSIIPIFDLMHRYVSGIPELESDYLNREKLYSREVDTANIILVDSEVGKQHVIDCYGYLVRNLKEKIRVLPFAAPDYIYDSKNTCKPSCNLFDKYIFYPAQFWTHKNHIRLLQSISELKKEGKIINLVLVGSEQNNKEAVCEYITNNDLSSQVMILGYVKNEEMRYLYQHARALVMPTLFGPTNIPQLEAFELGCPVATSGIFGIPNQVGDAAMLFDPNDVNDIKCSIRQLWDDDSLCNIMIERGKIRAQQWTREDFSRTFIKYLIELVNIERIG